MLLRQLYSFVVYLAFNKVFHFLTTLTGLDTIKRLPITHREWGVNDFVTTVPTSTSSKMSKKERIKNNPNLTISNKFQTKITFAEKKWFPRKLFPRTHARTKTHRNKDRWGNPPFLKHFPIFPQHPPPSSLSNPNTFCKMWSYMLTSITCFQLKND